MGEPVASRPYMPGYGLLGPGEGTGLLPWSWAEERLASSREYWVTPIRAFGTAGDDPTGSPTRWTFNREATGT